MNENNSAIEPGFFERFTATEDFGIIIPSTTNEVAQGFKRDQLTPTPSAQDVAR